MTQASDDYDPLYGLVRMDEHGPRDVLVRWSEMTDEERAAAWAKYEKAFGPCERREEHKWDS